MIRQLASRGLSIEEIAPSPEKQKSRRAATQRLHCRTVFLRVQRENNGSRKVPRCQQRICCFCFFRAGRKKKWRRLPQGEIFTARFCRNSFCKCLLRLEQKLCTRFCVTMQPPKTIAGLHRQRLPRDFRAASAASKTTLLSLSGKSLFLSGVSNTVLLSITFCALKSSPKRKRQILPASSQNLAAMRQHLAT